MSAPAERTLHVRLEPGQKPTAITVLDRHPDHAGYYRVGKAQAADWPEHDPDPIVTTADHWPAVAPRAVDLLYALAERDGWTVRVGYSRGDQRAVKVGTYKMVETFGVWARHPVTGWRWSAMHERTEGAATGWKWSRIAIWHPKQHRRFTHANLTDLKDLISVQGSVGEAWFKAVHARVEDQKAKAKTRAKTATKKGKEGAS